MVIRFIHVALLLTALGLLTGQALAGELRISADQQQLELGRPLWLTVYSDQTAISLENLDLSAWRERVALPRQFDVELAADNRSQRARLRVYPLRSGPLELPALYFMNDTSNSLTLNVRPAVEAGSGRRMNFQCRVPATAAWQMQELAVSCSLELSDGYALFRQDPVSTADLQILAMQKQQQRIGRGTQRPTRYQLGWLVVPSRAGEKKLLLPPIDYLRDGVVVRRFYVPPFTFKVRPLPAWLPGTVPVGRIRLVAYGTDRPWLDSGVLSQVRLTLQLDGVVHEMQPDYARQLRSDHDWRFYPAQTHSTTGREGQSLRRRLDYRIPLQARAIGIRRLPDLRLQYFDPASGSLRTLQVRGPLLFVSNGWIRLLAVLLMLPLLVYSGHRLWRAWRRYWHRYRTYRQALHLLARCDSLPGLRGVMLCMAQAEGWRSNLTYRQWQARMRRVSRQAAHIPVADLDAASYGGAAIDRAMLIQDLIRICRRRRLGLS